MGGYPSLFSPAPLQGRHHPLALVPWLGLPALLLFLISGFTSAPRIEEPSCGGRARKAQRGEGGGQGGIQTLAPVWGPLETRCLGACRELHPELESAGLQACLSRATRPHHRCGSCRPGAPASRR